MAECLSRGIKDIINQFPEIENILNEYGIGCGPCSVGTCLYRDIVEIHSLPANDEQQMMARIAKTMYAEKAIEILQIKRKTEAKAKEITY